MATNDGQRLTVFGLGFREHDNRHMQQILRHYQKLPAQINRASLYVALTLLAREVSQEDSQSLTAWLTNGGKGDEFPFGQAPPPALAPQPSANESLISYGHHSRHGRRQRLGADEDEDEDDEDLGGAGHVPYNPRFSGRGRTIEDGGPPGPARERADQLLQTAEEVDRVLRAANRMQVAGENVTGDEDEGDSDSDEDISGEQKNDEKMTGVATGTGTGTSPTETPAELECLVCYETLPSSDFPEDTITEGCQHETNACLSCINYSIQEPITRGALHLIVCPLCPEKLERDDIKEYATKEIFERYEYLYKRSQMPDTFIMCLNPKCDAGQIHEIDDPMMICNFCEFKTCVRHKLPWHEGQTCEEFNLDDAQLERLEDEEASAKMLASITSVCPKCKQGVMKSDGCDHMSCVCGNSWCFICMAEWENIIRHGDTAHAAWCDNHPNRVAKTKTQLEADKDRMSELLHGRPITAEERAARDDLQIRRVEKMRPLVVEAAEKRMQAAKEQQEKLKKQASASPEARQPTKKKVKLIAPWEEGGSKRKPL